MRASTVRAGERVEHAIAKVSRALSAAGATDESPLFGRSASWLRSRSDAMMCNRGRPGRFQDVVRKESEAKVHSRLTSGRRHVPVRPTLRAELLKASTTTALIITAAPSKDVPA